MVGKQGVAAPIGASSGTAVRASVYMSVSGEWQPLLVADSGFLGQLCFICQLVHHCVNASLLLYVSFCIIV
jgi:hypothetical protein